MLSKQHCDKYRYLLNSLLADKKEFDSIVAKIGILSEKFNHNLPTIKDDILVAQELKKKIKDGLFMLKYFLSNDKTTALIFEMKKDKLI